MRTKSKKIIILLFIAMQLFFCSSALAGMATFNDRRDVQNFINQMVRQYHFNGPWLSELFSHVQLRPELLRKIKRQKQAMPWSRYRNNAITPAIINNGLAFWNSHDKTLAIAEQRYGVPANMIVAIMGIETNYGRVTGNYSVLNTLSTLAFANSGRSNYFRKELAQYLLFTREHRLNPLAIKGSYAGAMGFPQFMPSSYRAFAVSADNKTPPDLFHNSNDAALSVANYFKNHGWQKDQPVAVSTQVTDDRFKRFANNSLQTKYTVKQLEQAGIKPKINLAPNTKANLLVLRDYDDYEYWLGLNNFYVITAYNNSQYYAMAVYQLAELLKQRKNEKRIATRDTTPQKR